MKLKSFRLINLIMKDKNIFSIKLHFKKAKSIH